MGTRELAPARGVSAVNPTIRLQLQGITKDFGPTRALDNVTMDVRPGEIHAILGQNGAGKSTLVKILAGVYRDFRGEVLLDGHNYIKDGRWDIVQSRIGVVHQEFPLVPQLSVAENIFLRRFPLARTPGKINWHELNSSAGVLLSSLNLPISPREKVENLNMGRRQLVAIARALATRPDVLVFDEATSTLTDREASIVFDILASLVKNGVSVIFISHRMEEILAIADRVTVLRDGACIDTVNVRETSKQALIQMMAGRSISDRFPKREHTPGETIMSVEGFDDGVNFRDCSFSLKAGEILGIAGLVGSGRSELLKAVFGAHRRTSGRLLLGGKEVTVRYPSDAISHGIFYVTSDRGKEGLLMSSSVRDNVTLGLLGQLFSRGPVINHDNEKATTQHFIKLLSIRTTGPAQAVSELSGGNQQKVIMARWLCGEGRVFLFDEPTRGLDVAVKYDVYNLMNELVKRGGSIVMISSELPELLAMSDRVIVMHEGRIVAEYDNQNLGQETVLAAMMGH